MTRDDFKEMLELAFNVANVMSQHEGQEQLKLCKLEHQTDFDGCDVVTLYVKGLQDAD